MAFLIFDNFRKCHLSYINVVVKSYISGISKSIPLFHNFFFMRKCLLLFTVILFIISCKKSDKSSVAPPNGLPKVQTNEISDFTYYSVKLSGQLLDSAGSAIKETGIVIDTISTPTISKNLDKFVLEKSKDGSFRLTVIGLLLNTTVYVRAYATNANGTGYGAQIKFTTQKGKIFHGQVYLDNQQQVNDFGANHYTTIDGDIEISGPVTDLTPLLGIKVINNGLVITRTSITNFSGLDSLEEIGAVFPNDFWVEGNSNLINFHGLSKLRESRGDVQFDNNNSLINLDGLDSYFAASAGMLRIGECAKLQNLNGLKRLSFVGDNLYIIDNPVLTDITGLSNVSQVYGTLYVVNNASLTNLNGLEAIQTLPSGVDIRENPVLRDISGLRNLSVIGGDDGYGIGSITVVNNPALTDISAFGKVTSVDYVTISNNNQLKNLQGLKSLQTITQQLDIEGNAILSDLSGLEKVASASRIQIVNNPLLASIIGLTGLTKISGNPYSLSISGNNVLVSLSGLENLAHADGSIDINSNPKLTEFCGLKNLFTKGYSASFTAEGNADNPTQQDVITNCP